MVVLTICAAASFHQSGCQFTEITCAALRLTLNKSTKSRVCVSSGRVSASVIMSSTVPKFVMHYSIKILRIIHLANLF